MGIKALYEGSQACVRVESRVSQWFEIRQGVRQGCVMSKQWRVGGEVYRC